MAIPNSLRRAARPMWASAVTLALTAGFVVAVPAAELSYRQLPTSYNGHIGIDYFEPNNELLLSAYYSNGIPRNFERLTVEGTHVAYTSINGISDEIRIATVRSPAMGGHPNTPYAPGTMFAPNGINGQILKVDPNGTVDLDWGIVTTPPNVGLFRGSLHVDRTGVWGGDLVGSTSQGYVFRINSAGVATQLGSPALTAMDAIFTVPNDPAIWGGLAGKIITGAEQQQRLYAYDTSGNMVWWYVNIAIQDFDMIVPDENLFAVNYGNGRLLAVDAQQFEDQGLVGKILVTNEFPGNMYALTWDFVNNRPHFEQITIAPGSPVSSISHFESVTFAPAGVQQIKTTLPTPHFSVSGSFGAVHDLDPKPIPTTAITRYAYNGTTRTGNPPEAQANTAVMALVEDPTGIISLMIVLDQTGNSTGGSLQLQLAAAGPGLTSSNTFINVQDDPAVFGDSYIYNAGSGVLNWTWTAGQTDGAVIRLPFVLPLDNPLSLWSITFSTLAQSGLDEFVFLADGQEIDLGNTGFNFTLSLIEPPQPGDYNFDGTVDTADYVAWRKNDGMPPQYSTWRTNFGEPGGGAGGSSFDGSSQANVPEPTSVVLALVGLFAVGSMPRPIGV